MDKYPKYENNNGSMPHQISTQERLKKRGGSHLSFLRCPVDGSTLIESNTGLTCQQGHVYPLMDGVYRLVTPEQTDVFNQQSTAVAQQFQSQGWFAPDVDTFRQLPQTGLVGWPIGYWQRRANVTAEFWRVLEAARRDAEMLPIGSMGYALDISDSTGWLAYCLDVSGFNTIGVSEYIGPYGLTAYPYARYLRVQMAWDKLPFEKRAFHLVVFSFSLDKVNQPEQILRKAAELLQPGGHLVVMLDLPDDEPNKNDKQDLATLSEKVMREAGLEVERRRVTPMGNPVNKIAQTLRRVDTPALVVGRLITG